MERKGKMKKKLERGKEVGKSCRQSLLHMNKSCFMSMFVREHVSGK